MPREHFLPPAQQHHRLNDLAFIGPPSFLVLFETSSGTAIQTSSTKLSSPDLSVSSSSNSLAELSQGFLLLLGLLLLLLLPSSSLLRLSSSGQPRPHCPLPSSPDFPNLIQICFAIACSSQWDLSSSLDPAFQVFISNLPGYPAGVTRALSRVDECSPQSCTRSTLVFQANS